MSCTLAEARKAAQVQAAHWIPKRGPAGTPQVLQDVERVRQEGACTGPATHREDCSVCMCEYLDQQEKVAAQILACYTDLQNEIAAIRGELQEESEAREDMGAGHEAVLKQIGLLWKVAESMGKRLGVKTP